MTHNPLQLRSNSASSDDKSDAASDEVNVGPLNEEASEAALAGQLHTDKGTSEGNSPPVSSKPPTAIEIEAPIHHPQPSPTYLPSPHIPDFRGGTASSSSSSCCVRCWSCTASLCRRMGCFDPVSDVDFHKFSYTPRRCRRSRSAAYKLVETRCWNWCSNVLVFINCIFVVIQVSANPVVPPKGGTDPPGPPMKQLYITSGSPRDASAGSGNEPEGIPAAAQTPGERRLLLASEIVQYITLVLFAVRTYRIAAWELASF